MNFDLIGFLWFAFKVIGLLFLIYFLFNLFIQTIISSHYARKQRQMEYEFNKMMHTKLAKGELDDFAKQVILKNIEDNNIEEDEEL